MPDTVVKAPASADPRFGSVGCVFFVIGAQKAGTTWLSYYFRSHPNVSVPLWKEHDYWNMVQGRTDPGRSLLDQVKRRAGAGPMKNLHRVLPFTKYGKRQKAITLALNASEAPVAPHSAYASVLLENAGQKTGAMGEFCPQYEFLDEETYAEMSGLSDNVRFIFIMRDPVSRFISGVQHHMRKTERVQEITPQCLSRRLKAFSGNPKSNPANRSRYDQTIAKLEGAVPSSHIMYVFFEELFVQSKVDEICDFLGVPSVPGNVKRKRNIAGKSGVSVSQEDRSMIARALKPVYDFAQNRFGSDLPRKWQESIALC